MDYPDVQADELYDMGFTARVCGNCDHAHEHRIMDDGGFDTFTSEVAVYCDVYEAEVETSHVACEEFAEC